VRHWRSFRTFTLAQLTKLDIRRSQARFRPKTEKSNPYGLEPPKLLFSVIKANNIKMSISNRYSPATSVPLSKQKAEIHKEIRKTIMVVIASDSLSPLPPSVRLGLASYQPSKQQHAQSLIAGQIFSWPENASCSQNPNLSRPSFFPTAMVSNNVLSAPTPPLHCAPILQPATPPHLVDFESWTISAPIII